MQIFTSMGKQTAIHVHKWICTLLLSIKRDRVSEWVKPAQSCPTLCDPPDSRPEYWSGSPFPSPGGLPNAGTEARSPASQADSLPAERAGKPRQTTETQPQVGEQTDRAWGSRLWAGPEYRGREEASNPARAARRCRRLEPRVGRRCGQRRGNQAPPTYIFSLLFHYSLSSATFFRTVFTLFIVLLPEYTV